MHSHRRRVLPGCGNDGIAGPVQRRCIEGRSASRFARIADIADPGLKFKGIPATRARLACPLSTSATGRSEMTSSIAPKAARPPYTTMTSRLIFCTWRQSSGVAARLGALKYLKPNFNAAVNTGSAAFAELEPGLRAHVRGPDFRSSVHHASAMKTREARGQSNCPMANYSNAIGGYGNFFECSSHRAWQNFA